MAARITNAYRISQSFQHTVRVNRTMLIRFVVLTSVCLNLQAATRIKNGYLTFKYVLVLSLSLSLVSSASNSKTHPICDRVVHRYYRQLCAVEIQRAYREFKKCSLYHDNRMRFEGYVRRRATMCLC